MITVYNNKNYRITYDGVSMVENALGNPNMIQISVVYGCEILVAPNEYGITFLPNGDFRKWYITSPNPYLNRTEAHNIYAKLSRDETDGMIVFSVNNYDFDGKIIGDSTSVPNETFFYQKIGNITATDTATPPTTKREINYDGGYLNTPQYNEDAGGWREMFSLTADNLINALKHFASFTVQGTIYLVGKLVLNSKTVSDIARDVDEETTIDDETLATTKYLDVKFINRLRKIFLNKDRNDRTDYSIEIGGTLTVEDIVRMLDDLIIGQDGFAPGFTGFGAMIDKYGNATMESLILRRFLEVPELRFNRISVTLGDKWNAPGAGIIERIDPDINPDGTLAMTGTAWLKLEKGEYGAIAVGDISMGIFHSETAEENAIIDRDDSLGNFQYAGFFTTYFTITEITGSDNKQFRYQLRPVSERWTFTHHPREAMNFICYGSFTNEERQTSTYTTRTYTRQLWHQNTWEISAANIAMQSGDLTNMSVHGLNMEGYSLYVNSVYFTGVIQQVKPDGTPINTANDLGDWVAGTKYDFYDRVSHRGSLWLCVNEDGTSTEPMLGDASWIEQVKAGQAGSETIIVQLSSENGVFFQGGVGETTLVATVYRGNTDITSDIPTGRFTWTRKGRDPTQDELWNAAHQGVGNSIDINMDDVNRSAVFDCNVSLD